MTPPGITRSNGTTLPKNKASGSTNVHEARTALGKRLREARQVAGLNGRQLAESLSWPPSKVSKLENGRQTPTDDDIRAWTDATHTQDETDALLASLHTLEVQYAEWQRIFRTGLKPRQRQHLEWDQKTRFIRAFEASLIPGLLQTAEYARFRFADGIRRLKLPNDLDDVVALRVKRQEILYRPDKRFHFVLTEAALRYRLCPTEVMIGQLDRLLSLSQLPNVRLGIIAFETQYDTAPKHGFWIYDEERVLIETVSAALDLRQPQEVELYANTFEQLAAVASYGRSARKIINRVIGDIAPEDESGDSG
ncbi:MAG TPA: helix-turn-helix transcriptional regulator [Actinophytocola sp.]|uniref:helix-turn-helix domain-containing protein n=1 Tax=Actinophytocola sp. TaxID=1872138 RepID=UPI002DC02B00|nr:helix-turn-helix transcriptional regulator [Actinophytocola sp.]HEU5472264.1 helix-turn-helix transcriptional regulator [Actinophytocola sp.]